MLRSLGWSQHAPRTVGSTREKWESMAATAEETTRQAGLVAESLADYLMRRPEFVGPGTTSMYLTTGDPVRVGGKATQFLRAPIRFEAA